MGLEKPAPGSEWNQFMTLEELIRDAFARRREFELIEMIKMLPPGIRDKCRRIWKEECELRKINKT